MAAWTLCLAAGLYAAGQGWRLPGFFLGALTSLIYFLLMAARVRKSAELPVKQAVTYMRLGWLVRLSFIVLMLFLSIKVPLFDFWAAVAGLFSLQMVLFINAVVVVTRSFFSRV